MKQIEKTNLTRNHVKLCALCGTLNHLDNAECWTCRWHGEFSQDQQIIALAWQRLESLYEEVRFEHLTSRKMRAIGDFGALRPRSCWQDFWDNRHVWRQNLRTKRDRFSPAPNAASREK